MLFIFREDFLPVSVTGSRLALCPCKGLCGGSKGQDLCILSNDRVTAGKFKCPEMTFSFSLFNQTRSNGR